MAYDFSRMSDEELQAFLAENDENEQEQGNGQERTGTQVGEPVTAKPQNAAPVPITTDDEAKAKGDIGITEAAQLGYESKTGLDASDNPLLAQYENMSANHTQWWTESRRAALQDLASGTTTGWDGVRRHLTRMDDDELDYLMDKAGANGFGGFGKWALSGVTGMFGSRAPSRMRGEDNIMRQWDETDGAKIADPVERRDARVKYAQEIAKRILGEDVATRQNAKTEFANREKTNLANIITGGAEMGGYTLSFLTPQTMWLNTAAMAAGKGQEYANDEMMYDEDGNLVTVAKGDSRGRAALKGIGTALFETGSEIAGGKIGMAALKRGGRILGKGLEKLAVGGKPLFEKVGGKLAETEVGQATGRFMTKFNDLFKWTSQKAHLENPFEENLEELETDWLNAITGFGARDSEQKDTNGFGRLANATKDFFTPQNLLELNEAMLLTMGAGAFVAKFNADRYHANRRMLAENGEFARQSEGHRVDDLIRAHGLMTDEQLKDASSEAKVAALNAWVNGLSEDDVRNKLNAANGLVDRLANRIAGQNAFADEVVKVVDQMNGNAGANHFSNLDWRSDEVPGFDVEAMEAQGLGQDLTADDGQPARVYTDQQSGVSVLVTQNADSSPRRFKVYGANNALIGQYDTPEEAQNMANVAAKQQNVRVAEREAKMKFLGDEAERLKLAGNVNVVASMNDLRNMFPSIAEDEDFNANNHAVVIPAGTRMADGSVVESNQPFLILDNISTKEEMSRKLLHEVGVHMMLDQMLPGDAEKARFLNSISPKAVKYGVDYVARNYEMTPQQVMSNVKLREEALSHSWEAAMGSSTLGDKLTKGFRDFVRNGFGVDLPMNDAELRIALEEMRNDFFTGGGSVVDAATPFKVRQDMEARSVDAETGVDGTLEDLYAQGEEGVDANYDIANATGADEQIASEVNQARANEAMQIAESEKNAQRKADFIAAEDAERENAEIAANQDEGLGALPDRTEGDKPLTKEQNLAATKGVREQRRIARAADAADRQAAERPNVPDTELEAENERKFGKRISVSPTPTAAQAAKTVDVEVNGRTVKVKQVFREGKAWGHSIELPNGQTLFAQGAKTADAAVAQMRKELDARIPLKKSARTAVRGYDWNGKDSRFADWVRKTYGRNPGPKYVDDYEAFRRANPTFASGEEFKPFTPENDRGRIAKMDAGGVRSALRMAGEKGDDLKARTQKGQRILDDAVALSTKFRGQMAERLVAKLNAAGEKTIDGAIEEAGHYVRVAGKNAPKELTDALAKAKDKAVEIKRTSGALDAKGMSKKFGIREFNKVAPMQGGPLLDAEIEETLLKGKFFSMPVKGDVLYEWAEQNGRPKFIFDASGEGKNDTKITNLAERLGFNTEVNGRGENTETVAVSIIEAAYNERERYQKWREEQEEDYRNGRIVAAREEVDRLARGDRYDAVANGDAGVIREIEARADAEANLNAEDENDRAEETANDVEVARAFGDIDWSKADRGEEMVPFTVDENATKDKNYVAFLKKNPSALETVVTGLAVNAGILRWSKAPSGLSDTELARKAADGDEKALVELFEKNRKPSGKTLMAHIRKRASGIANGDESFYDDLYSQVWFGSTGVGSGSEGGYKTDVSNTGLHQLMLEKPETFRDNAFSTISINAANHVIADYSQKVKRGKIGVLAKEESDDEGNKQTVFDRTADVSNQTGVSNPMWRGNREDERSRKSALSSLRRFVKYMPSDESRDLLKEIVDRIDETGNDIGTTLKGISDAALKTRSHDDVIEMWKRFKGAFREAFANSDTQFIDNEIADLKENAPSKVDQFHDLKRKGLSDAAIAKRLGIAPNQITVYKQRADRKFGTSYAGKYKKNKNPEQGEFRFSKAEDMARETTDEREQRAIDQGGRNLRWSADLTGVGRPVGDGPNRDSAKELLSASRRESANLGGVEEDRRKYAHRPFADGEEEKGGTESYYVLRSADGTRVRKYRATQDGTMSKAVMKIVDHNALFGDKTPYVVKGVAEDGRFGPMFVLEQPYVEFEPNSGERARQILKDDMERRFGEAHWEDGELRVGNGKYAIDDLKDLNIGIDKATGDYSVIDAKVYREKGYGADRNEVPNVDAAGNDFTELRRQYRFSKANITPAEDAAYMDAVNRGDTEYAQQMVNDRIRSIGGVFHRGKSPNETQDIVEWADNPDEILSYGEHQYAHLPKHLAEIPKFVYDFAREYYPDASEDAIQDGVNPSKIVDSAGAWDDRGFVSALWDRYSSELEEMMENGVAGFKTADGAVSFPQDNGNLFKSADPVTYDDAGNVIPLSERFNPENDDIRYNPSELKGFQDEDNADGSAVANGANRRDGRNAPDESRVTPQTVGIADGGESFDFRGGRAYGTGDIEKLYHALNANEGSAKIADRVFDAAKKLGVSYSFSELEASDSSIAAAGAEFPGGFVMYDTRHLNSGILSPQQKADIVLHEAIHGVTTYAINIVNGEVSAQRGVAVNDRLREAVNELKAIHREVSRLLPNEYGATHETEFVAELAKAGFRNKLKELGLWDRITRTIARIIDAIVGRESVHDAAMRNLGDLLDNIDEDAFRATRANTLKLGGNDFSGATGVTNPNVRFSIANLYTGSAADYEKPSLLKVGTGEGAQVYGYGLYASNRRGIAEGYAKRDKRDKLTGKTYGGVVGFGGYSRRNPLAATIKYDGDIPKNVENYLKYCGVPTEFAYDNYMELSPMFMEEGFSESEVLEVDPVAKWLHDNEGKYEIIPPEVHENLYEQTFFTNRPEGDESHLLKWYEPVSEENLGRIKSQARKEGLDDIVELADKTKMYGSLAFTLYENLTKHLGSPKAASEFLARADIDGIKYPVDSYGKTVKDGDKAGWNYVSFRDDNIRVDHKWVDGEMLWSKAELAALSFRNENGKLSQDEIDDGYRNAIRTAGPLAERFLSVVQNDNGGREEGGAAVERGNGQVAQFPGIPSSAREGYRNSERDFRSATVGDEWRETPLAQLRTTVADDFPGEPGVKEHSGTDAVVRYDSANNEVVKAIELEPLKGYVPSRVMQRIIDFNFFFGDISPIRLEAFGANRFGENESVPYAIVRQKYAQGDSANHEKAWQMLFDMLDEKFGNVFSDGHQIYVGNKRISDLDSKNLVLDEETGKPFVRDADIYTQGDLLWSKSEATPLANAFEGMSKERLNDLRSRYGLPPIDRYRKVSDAEVERDAKGLMNNVTEVDNRIDAILAKPRAVNAEEVAAFGMRSRQLADAYDEKNAQIAEAIERGNRADIERLSAEADAIHKRIDDVTTALRKTGSIAGRVLRMFRLGVDRNLSLNQLTREMQGRKGEEPLTEEERKDIRDLYDALHKAISEKDAIAKREFAQRIRAAISAELDNMARGVPASVRTNPNVGVEINQKFNDALKQLDAWNDTSGGILLGLKGVQGTLNDILRYHVANGVGKGHTGKARYDALMGALLGTVREHLPSVTMEELEQQLSQYGISRPVSIDETEALIRDTDGYARRLRRLSDLLKNHKGPLKTGDATREPDPILKKMDADFRRQLMTMAVNGELDPETLKGLVDKRLAQLDKRLDDLHRQIFTGDFKKGEDALPRLTSPEIEEKERLIAAALAKKRQMRHRMELVEKPWNIRLGQNYLSDWWDVIGAAPRVLRTMLDLSATGAQGAALFTSHPVEGAKALWKSIKAFYSEKNADDIQRFLDADKDFQDFKDHGGHAYAVTDISADGVPEEFMLADASVKIGSKEISLDKIPGVKASERSFATFLNLMNLSLYKAMKNGGGWMDGAGPTEMQKKDLAMALNVASGYGYDNAGSGFWDRAMSTAFWAPRYFVSGIKQSVGYEVWSPLFRGGKSERQKGERINSSKQLAKEEVRRLTAMAAWTFLFTMLFGRKDPEWLEEMLDPRNTRFMNVKIGDGEVNFLGPMKQWIVFLSRSLTGKTMKNGVETNFRRADATGRLIRGKLAPLVGLVYDLAIREDYNGKKIDFGVAPFKKGRDENGKETISGAGHIMESFGVPLSIADFKEAWEENGLANAMALAPFAITGFSKSHAPVSDYDLVTTPYRRAKSEYNKLVKAKDWKGAQAYFKAHPVLARQNQVDALMKSVRAYEKQMKGYTDKGKDVPQNITTSLERAQQRVVEALKRK